MVVIAGRPGAAAGSESNGRTGTLGRIRSHAPGFLKWAAVLFVASLFVPALTKQWNDRTQELDVKQALLADIVRETADAVYGAQEVSLQPDEQLLEAKNRLYGAWLRGRTALETPMFVYFDESEAADHWRGRGQLGFRNAVLLYALMSCCDEARAQHIAMLKKYLNTAETLMDGGDPWSALRCGPGEDCTPASNYDEAYRWLGNRILEQRLVLWGQLFEANGEGFSSGWRDFIGDLNPLD
jgi:hypothetical protein